MISMFYISYILSKANRDKEHRVSKSRPGVKAVSGIMNILAFYYIVTAQQVFGDQ